MRIISLIATYRQMDLGQLELWNSLDERIINDLLNKYAVEYVILRTCNRFEIYAVTGDEVKGIEDSLLNLGPNGKILEGVEAIRHLIEVASGMDSMVPGEQDIQRQVKEAIKKSIQDGTSGKYLNYIFMRALSVSKEVRSSTRIGNGIVSLPQASVRIVESIIQSGNVAVIGTGRVAETLLRYLRKRYVVDVFGRNEKKLAEIEQNFGVKCIQIGKLKEKMGDYDALFSALKMEGYILKSSDFSSRKPLVVVDLGNPRNVENPGDRYFIDLDYLKEYVSKNISIRVMEMEKAKGIIDEKLKKIEKRLMNYQVEDLIASLYEKAMAIKEEEVNEMLRYIGNENKEYVEKFANSLVKKILGGITRNIREGKYDSKTMEELKRILG